MKKAFLGFKKHHGRERDCLKGCAEKMEKVVSDLKARLLVIEPEVIGLRKKSIGEGQGFDTCQG